MFRLIGLLLSGVIVLGGHWHLQKEPGSQAAEFKETGQVLVVCPARLTDSSRKDSRSSEDSFSSLESTAILSTPTFNWDLLETRDTNSSQLSLGSYRPRAPPMA